MILPPKIFFSKHQNKAEFKNLDDSKVLSSDFPFCGMDHQKSNFLLILALFLSEAVETSRCYFFENWWMKLKCPLLLKPLATIVQENFQSFYPSEPFRIIHFTMRHPVINYVSIFSTTFDTPLPYVTNRQHFNNSSLKSTSAFYSHPLLKVMYYAISTFFKTHSCLCAK